MLDELPTIVYHIGVGPYCNSVESVIVKIIYIFMTSETSRSIRTTTDYLRFSGFHYYDVVFTKTIFFQSQYYDAYCYYSCLLRTYIYVYIYIYI